MPADLLAPRALQTTRRPLHGAVHAGGPGIRVAAIDIGTNAIRFVAAEMTGPRHYLQLENHRVPVRLGRGQNDKGRLDPVAFRAALVALARIAKRLRQLGVLHYRAVATSAVRESGNGKGFVSAAKRRSGLRIEIISSTEEIRLVHVAARTRLDPSVEPYILVDIGGGSVEIAFAKGGELAWTESHTIGAVRLLEEYSGEAATPVKFRRLIEEGLESFRLHNDRPEGSVRLVGTGGNIEALAQLADSNEDGLGVRTLSVSKLDDLIQSLCKRDAAARAEAFGLPPDRADVILPAALVFRHLARFFKTDEILVPEVGVKEGLLLDQAQALLAGPQYEKDKDALLHHGVLAVGRRFKFDEAHCLHVADLSGKLLDALQRLHKLPKTDRRILWAAASLHDVGKYIDERKHHKHSAYLLLNTEIPGLSSADQRIVATVARYHRKSLPDRNHDPYKHLTSTERRRVDRLAMILRIADALDREHLQRVKQLDVRMPRRRVQLRLHGKGDLLLERWSVERESAHFAKVFRRDLVIETGAEKNGR